MGNRAFILRLSRGYAKIVPNQHEQESFMDLGITGKRALVCASSQGLGKGCAMALAEAGVDLVLNARRADILDESAHEI